MTDIPTARFPTPWLYDRPSPQVLAILRVLRAVPAPTEPGHSRTLRAAAGRTGRILVDAEGGRLVLGWHADADGVWAGDAIDGIRSARPAAPRILRTLAACIRCCWPEPNAPLYPSAIARVNDVLAVAAALSAAQEIRDSGLGVERHAKGALTTLDAAALIDLDRASATLRLGPVVATWTERDISVLREVWYRMPTPPTSDAPSVVVTPSVAVTAPIAGLMPILRDTPRPATPSPVTTARSGPSLDALDDTRRADVLAALRAVEEAERPVPRAAFRALSDEGMRASVERVLADSGRVLLETPRGVLSGYADGVREALAKDGIGVLPPDDRAVLTLILLHSIAIPRARGTIPREADWTVGEAVSPQRLFESRKIPDSAIRSAVRRLRDAGIVGFGRDNWIVPGPQFARLTPAAIASLFEELVLLAEPDGLLAESIRRRRAARHRPAQLGEAAAPQDDDIRDQKGQP